MKTVLLIFAGICMGAIALAFFVRIPQDSPKIATVSIDDKTLAFEVVDTPELRTQGLSGRKSLLPNTGMLFVFDTSDVYGFWMKDMFFSLDIIWLDNNFTVVHLEQNVSPETYPSVFIPNEKALYVLEVNAGVSNELHIEKGTQLEVVFK
ncbi:MAG: DUF192 domain-containing protein [Candidatus Campbellbacteria bacterium]|nr:DUF192 domain-containing protein [Candidatus Campbellbacteria bacterium]